MKLNNQELYQLFIDKGVSHLFHANTIATSITFIEQGGLISRGVVESNGLYQSPQSSDAIDKAFDVWNDVFLDTIDLHNYFNRQNSYGPSTFKFSINLLIKEQFEVWITKDNPKYWERNMTESEKYFVNVQELRDNWHHFQRQRKMVTIRGEQQPILFNYLEQVTIDDPRLIVQGVTLFNASIAGLKKAIGNNVFLKNKFMTRICTSCYCRSNYQYQVTTEDKNRLFLPK